MRNVWDLPLLAVGNHDWHANRVPELSAVLANGGVTVLDRSFIHLNIRGHDVGVVGTKGFVGGFPGSHLPDFREPLLREVYRTTTQEAEALEHALSEIALCPTRIVLLHYAPTAETIVGEDPGIWAFLGSDRLAAPIGQHEPNMVLHGHAHRGTFQGAIDNAPVYNVAIPVTGHDFWMFELEVDSAAQIPIR